MSADSPRRSSGSATRTTMSVPAIVPPQVVSDRSILDSAIGFINEVTLANQPAADPKDTITWARFEITADISDPCFGDDWELEGNVAPPLLLILGYGLGVQVWAIPANGEAVEVLSWRHGIVTTLRVLPTPLPTINSESNSRADEPIDAFVEKRPLIALVDGSSTSGSQPQFCAVNFISLKTGVQVKTIKFKNPVIDILANRSSVVITFHERIAVFDARTLEDRLSITTCYPSPGINPNPAALGSRWLAYAENKLLHSKRSGGGCDGDGVASYTATVLNASKSLVKGLRELGEHVAAGLTGTSGSTVGSKNASFDSGCGLDAKQAGVVTIIDIKNPLRNYGLTSGTPTSSGQIAGTDTIIAHFIAHSEALVAMEFDNSGMLLVTADRRGHDFHVFRIQPNPVGSSLAAVHHLYILHRGDTSAKVQNITLTLDSRWVAVSTLRGTTHVFPITPYGGAMGVRTHTSLHVVNKLSRFHRSAGLSGEARSNSPIAHSESTTFSQSLQPYYNSTLPPFPRPTVVTPLAQLRQPFALGSPPGSASLVGVKSAAGGSGSGAQRQRLSSLSDDSGKPLSVCSIFAKSRSWLLDPPNVTREAPHRMQRKAVDSLFVMAGHGALIQYDLGTKLASNVAKDKICDDTPIELEVEAKAQWNLGRRKEGSQEIMPPLSPDNWLIKNRNSCMLSDSSRQYDDADERNESWLAQVEIITHAGPHRRLWMGPQFVFKTYNTPSGSNLNHVDIEAVEIGTIKSNSTSEKLDRSSPLNMPLTAAGRSSTVPVLIESGSYSSIEQSPKLMDRFRHDHLNSDYSVAHGDSRLKEDLADAMRESPSSSAAASSRDAGGHACESGGSSDNVAFYDALTAEDDQIYLHARSASAAALASVLPNIHSYDNSSSFESLDSAKKPKSSIEKIVNPLGTVTTVTACLTADVKTDILDEVVSQLAAEDTIIHENCDESLFRPFVAIFCDENTLRQNQEKTRRNCEKYQPPEAISNKLVVPVIAKEVNDELSKREKEKCSAIKSRAAVIKTKAKEQQNFEEFLLIKNSNEKKKTNNAKRNMRAEVCVEENISQKVDSVVVKHENPVNPIIQEAKQKRETACLKNSTSLKESSAEVDGAQKIKPKDLRIEKHLKELHKQTVDIASDGSALQKIQPETEFKKQSTKELPDSLEENNDRDLNVKDIILKADFIETKSKTKRLNSNEREQKVKDTFRASKERKDQELIYKVSSDLNLSTSVSHKAEQQNLAKIKNDNEKNKPEPISDTAMKEKINKLDTHNTIMINPLNVQQPADDRIEVEKIEKKIEANEAIKSSVISTKKGNKNINLTANPFECEKKNSVESKLHSENVNVEPLHELQHYKDRDESKTSEKTLSPIEQKKINQKKDFLKEECKESSKNSLNKSEKNKGTLFSHKEENLKQSDVVFNRELDLGKTKTSTVEEKLANEVKSDAESLNPKVECKDKSRKTKCDNKEITKTKLNEQQCSGSVKQSVENDGKNIPVNSSGDIEKPKKNFNQSKKENLLQLESKTAKLQTENEIKSDKRNEILKKMKTEEACCSNQTKYETTDCELITPSAKYKDLYLETAPVNIRPDISNEVKKNASPTQETTSPSKDLQKIELLAIKPNTKATANEIKSNTLTPNPSSPKKRAKEIRKPEAKKDVDLSKKKTSFITAMDKENVENVKKEIVRDDREGKSKSAASEKELSENYGKPNKAIKQMSAPTLPPTSAWKTLSGADILNKSLTKTDSALNEFPLLGAVGKLNNYDKLLPELPTPAVIGKQTNLDEFSVLKLLEPLPPLPALEPLQIMAENKSTLSNDISLMTFESPLLEDMSFQRKITPAPRGFTEQNLILALCGSLHYENEHIEKAELPQTTFSSNHSSINFEDASLAGYKSLSENDDPYMSLDQSSQDTNTITTNTTNEKFSSSTNSSGSEEIVIIMEENKMTKKQKRKRQQQLKEIQKQHLHQEIDDEELRPLIAMTDSQGDPTTNLSKETLSASAVNFDKNKNSTTTDSEDLLPATTSDENVFSVRVPNVHNPHKIKTKKLEHKINLIAAIEAATSSSTSSAEESGVELEGRSSYDNGESLISVANSVSTSTIPLAIGSASLTPVGALKKKTKRRKR